MAGNALVDDGIYAGDILLAEPAMLDGLEDGDFIIARFGKELAIERATRKADSWSLASSNRDLPGTALVGRVISVIRTLRVPGR
jgi:SOS-response transcriptional repressor LexA